MLKDSLTIEVVGSIDFETIPDAEKQVIVATLLRHITELTNKGLK